MTIDYILKTFAEKGLRFLVRDLMGEHCVDYAVDVMPKRRRKSALFPLREVRRWKLADFAGIGGTDDPRQTMDDWVAAMMAELAKQPSERMLVLPVDYLHLNLERQRWWKTENREALWILFQALRAGEDAKWEEVIREIADNERTKSYATIQHTFDHGGLPIMASSGAPSAALVPLIERYRQSQGKPGPGYWNPQHALMTVREFIRVFEPNEDAALAIEILTRGTSKDTIAVAHTRLVRPGEEWFVDLASELQGEKLLGAVWSLRMALDDAGLRPMTAQPPPLLSPKTSLRTLADVAGTQFLPGEMLPLLAARILTIEELARTWPARLLELAPVLPSDIQKIRRTLEAVGYRYPYAKEDFARLSPSP